MFRVVRSAGIRDPGWLSEHVFHGELQYASRRSGCRWRRRIRLNYPKGVRATCRKSWVSTVKAVRNIESFEAQFNLVALRDIEASRNRAIPFPKTRTHNGTLPEIPESAYSWSLKGLGVQVLNTERSRRTAGLTLSGRNRVGENQVRALGSGGITAEAGHRIGLTCDKRERLAAPRNN